MKLFFVLAAALLLCSGVVAAEKYLVVTTSDVAASGALDALKEHRAGEFEVIEVLVDGYSAKKVRKTVRAYDADYVLIVGDKDAVPTHVEEHEHDVMRDGEWEEVEYVYLDDQYYHDKAGRIPTTDADLIRTYAGKVVRYETESQHAIKEVGLIAGSQAVPHTSYISSTLLEDEVVPFMSGWDLERSYCYCQEGCPGADESAKNVLGGGSSVVFFVGHGNEDSVRVGCCATEGTLDRSEVSGMSNEVTPVLLSAHCDAVKHESEGFAYELLFQDGGVVAFFGSTTTAGNRDFIGIADTFLGAERLGDFAASFGRRDRYDLLGDPALFIGDHSRPAESAGWTWIEYNDGSSGVSGENGWSSRNVFTAGFDASQIRIRVGGPKTVGFVSICERFGSSSDCVPGSLQYATFDGEVDAVEVPGGGLFSDDMSFEVVEGRDYMVTLYGYPGGGGLRYDGEGSLGCSRYYGEGDLSRFEAWSPYDPGYTSQCIGFWGVEYSIGDLPPPPPPPPPPPDGDDDDDDCECNCGSVQDYIISLDKEELFDFVVWLLGVLIDK